jgi:N-acetylated-alpha-linked acidic dipeptidase
MPRSQFLGTGIQKHGVRATLKVLIPALIFNQVDVYYPVMNTPLDRSLQVLDEDGEVIWDAHLEEVADDTDPEAGKYFASVPTFHGLSPSGDVQGKLVYANYGRKEASFFMW